MDSERSLSPISQLKQFLALESAGGAVLGVAALLALILANSPLGSYYTQLLDVPIGLQVGSLLIKKPLLLWVNDGLMAIFFMLIGLEVKREILAGELSDRSKAVLPVIAALGGMATPALIYAGFNWGDAEALRGWAIPTATDIAFALAVLSLVGARVAPSLRLFLLAVAITDDLGAIAIIAIFYTAELSWAAFAAAGAGIAMLIALNIAGVTRRAPYVLTGAFLWVCVLKSGIHATLAGVVVGLAVPLRNSGRHPPLLELERALHPWVAFGVLPVFAFANAGVRLVGISSKDLIDPIQLGIVLGLFIGKQFGVALATWIATRVGLGRLPEGANWRQIYGLALLTGIGFTMSLFIGTLAFPAAGYDLDIRVAVMAASLLSAASGYLLLRAGAVTVQPKSTVTTS